VVRHLKRLDKDDTESVTFKILDDISRRVSHAEQVTKDGTHHRRVIKYVTVRRELAELKKEAAMYNGPLKSLQGEVVPRFYGLFVGTSSKSYIAFLAFDNCGKALDRSFNRVEMRFAIKIYEAFRRIHDAGIFHGDAEPRNVLRTSDDNAIVIDFETAGKHRCRRALEVIEDAEEPTIVEFGCKAVGSGNRFGDMDVKDSRVLRSGRVSEEEQGPYAGTSPEVAPRPRGEAREDTGDHGCDTEKAPC